MPILAWGEKGQLGHMHCNGSSTAFLLSQAQQMAKTCLQKTHRAYATCNLDPCPLSLEGPSRGPRAVDGTTGGTGILGTRAKGALACEARPHRPW